MVPGAPAVCCKLALQLLLHAAAAAGNENPRVASVARRSLARQVTATDERESGRER